MRIVQTESFSLWINIHENVWEYLCQQYAIMNNNIPPVCMGITEHDVHYFTFDCEQRTSSRFFFFLWRTTDVWILNKPSGNIHTLNLLGFWQTGWSWMCSTKQEFVLMRKPQMEAELRWLINMWTSTKIINVIEWNANSCPNLIYDDVFLMFNSYCSPE